MNQSFINSKLIELGSSLLKDKYKKLWTKQYPTTGYCYIVSEALYHFSQETYTACCINLGEEYGTHWYLKQKETGEIVDFTANQFPFSVDYSKGIGMGFLKGGIKTNRGFISKRGYEMAKHLGLI